LILKNKFVKFSLKKKQAGLPTFNNINFGGSLKEWSLKKLDINPKAKALIFDLDGTLADTMPVHFIAYKNILAGYGIVFNPELFKNLAGIPAEGTIRKLNEIFGANMDAKSVSLQKELEYEKMMDHIKPVEPVIELVKKYHGKLPMSIGTGGSKRLAWKSLNILKLDSYFDILVSMEDVEHPKPHPEVFLKCAGQMGVEPRFCHVFEDGPLGIQAAKNAGMMATLVTPYYKVTIGEDF
jgi:beta-phosphoglucomutase family hydrolase